MQASKCVSSVSDHVSSSVSEDRNEDDISPGTLEQFISDLNLTQLTVELDKSNFFQDIVQKWSLKEFEWNRIKHGDVTPHVNYMEYLATTNTTINQLKNALEYSEMTLAYKELRTIISNKQNLKNVSDLAPQDKHQLCTHLIEDPHNPSKKSWRNLANALNHSKMINNFAADKGKKGVYSSGEMFLKILIARHCRIRKMKHELGCVLQNIPAVQAIYEVFMNEVRCLEKKRKGKAIAESTIISTSVKRKKGKLKMNVQLKFTEGCKGVVNHEQIQDGSKLSCLLSKSIATVISKELGFQCCVTQNNSELNPRPIHKLYTAKIKLVFRATERRSIPLCYNEMTSPETIEFKGQIIAIGKETCKEVFDKDVAVTFPGWYIGSLVVLIAISKISGEEWKDDELYIIEEIFGRAMKNINRDMILESCTLRTRTLPECDVLYYFAGEIPRSWAQVIPETILDEKLKEAILGIPLTISNVRDERERIRNKRRRRGISISEDESSDTE